MNPSPDRSLGGFERRLLTELRAVVELQARHERPASASADRPMRARSARVMRRRSIAGVASAASVASVVALFVLSAGSAFDLAQAFPIFARPAMTISRGALGEILRQQGATLRDARLDVQHARGFFTPLGTGYVVTDTQANVICVAAPGFPARGADTRSWGATCGTASLAARDGAGELQTYGSVGQASYVEILPKNATASIRRPGGMTRTLPTPNGVLAIVAHHPLVIITHIAGRSSTTIIRPPFRSLHVAVPPRTRGAAPVQFRITPGSPYARLSASFRTRYPVHAGDSAYVLEYAPIPGTQPQCPGGEHPGDVTDDQTNRDIAAGTRLTLRGGAPDCAGRWRVTVYFAASRGEVHYPGQAWAQPLFGAATPPPGSGNQIVAASPSQSADGHG